MYIFLLFANAVHLTVKITLTTNTIFRCIDDFLAFIYFDEPVFSPIWQQIKHIQKPNARGISPTLIYCTHILLECYNDLIRRRNKMPKYVIQCNVHVQYAQHMVYVPRCFLQYLC